jgi:hypothetical protein
MNIDYFKQHKLAIFWFLIAFVAAGSTFLFTAYSHFPVEIRTIASTFRFSFVSTSVIVLLTFYLILRLPEPWRMVAVFSACGALFGLALAGLWASGQSEPYVVSGLIPYNDAATYYIDANRLLDGSILSEASSHRPIAIGLLGAILGITGRNLQNATAVLVFIEVIACSYLALEVRRVKGAAAGAITLWIAFLFARRFAGTTMTETLGLSLGALALVFLLRGAAKKSLPTILAGLFLISLALNVRAGAFFLLPVLVLWTGWLFREKKILGWKPTLLAGLAIVVGFGINNLTFNLIGNTSSQLFSNFAESLYGLAAGGERWSYVYDLYPYTRSLPEKQKADEIYRLAFELIRSNPVGIFKGAVDQWGLLFSDTWFSVYSYVGGEDTAGNRNLHLGLYALCLVAIVQSVRKWKDPLYSFLLVSMLGVFISVPFVPPGDAHKMRAFAATIPVLALLPAIGMSELMQLSPWRKLKELPSDDNSTVGLTGFTSLLVVFIIAAPYIAMKTAVPPVIKQPQCQPGEVPVNMHYEPGNAVRLIREDVMQLDWLPEFHYGRYKVFIHNLPNEEAFKILEKVEPPAMLLLGYDIPTSNRVWMLAGTDQMPKGYGILQVCGKYYETDEQIIQRYNFYYPRVINLQP